MRPTTWSALSRLQDDPPQEILTGPMWLYRHRQDLVLVLDELDPYIVAQLVGMDWSLLKRWCSQVLQFPEERLVPVTAGPWLTPEHHSGPRLLRYRPSSAGAASR